MLCKFNAIFGALSLKTAKTRLFQILTIFLFDVSEMQQTSVRSDCELRLRIKFAIGLLLACDAPLLFKKTYNTKKLPAEVFAKEMLVLGPTFSPNS